MSASRDRLRFAGLDSMAPHPQPPIVAPTSRNGLSSLEQNRAAGGAEFRRLRTKSKDIVTVSVDVVESGENAFRARLRFKFGGATVQRSLGSIEAPNRFKALKLAWALLKSERIAESEGWSWVTPTTLETSQPPGSATELHT